ncbi:hypothetical protein DJ010_02105 [Nocardioides silvaticus]|uniref:DUF3105 domain-containing protein n=1 Tax=Nocardioides silvaticus TaxID=2201891 RepID=A0A316TIM6_9ACTN|nr:DUF3105 domain-containing protein [Nocardioides silvaticus]PWN04453.1 hypothetical protein DJ010_02105 [Nocardioides silvaticus]
MAKTTKSEKSDRQKVIDDIRRKQKSAEQRQGRAIVGAAIAVGLVIVGIPAYLYVFKPQWEQIKYNGKPLDEIGASASVCQDVTTKKANGSNDHRPTGEQIEYDDAPVAFGPHWNEGGVAPVSIEKRYYTKDSRPELEALVHNLEHGFTILWYDETAADDGATIGEIKAIADRLNDSDTNNRLSFIAAPWTSEDGGDFPDGQHIAFTHWSSDPTTGDSEGVWQYCSEPSGEALEQFMKDYPYYDAPEPIGGYVGQ